MARMPGAVWRPVAHKSRSKMSKVRRVNVHVAASRTRSLWSYFNRGGNPDSHFYVLWDGTVEQYVDTANRAYCDLEGNSDTISIETQGGLDNPNGERFTPEQVEAIARIYAWAVKTHGVPVRVARDSKPGTSSQGLGWHRLGIDGNFPNHYPLWGRRSGGLRYSNSAGKMCPGSAKIGQIPEIYERACARLGGASSAPLPTPGSARPNVEIQFVLAVLGLYDAGPDLKYIDGANGPAQHAAVTTYQKTRGLTADGWWGSNTDKHFEVNDMAKIVDEISRGVASFNNAGKDGASLWTRIKNLEAELDKRATVDQVRDSDSFHVGKLHEATQRDLNRLVVPLLETLAATVAKGGEGVDREGLLLDIQASAKKGAYEGVVAAETTLHEVVMEALDKQAGVDAEAVAIAVVSLFSERLEG